MNTAQAKTFAYWKNRYPELTAQAVAQSGAQGQAGFGQTDTFSSVMSNLTGLLQSYGQYRIASDVANSTTAANRNTLALPGSGVPAGTRTINWVLVGGVGLLTVVGLALILKKRR